MRAPRADERLDAPHGGARGILFRLARDERGATFVEYMVIMLLVAIVSLIAWSALEAAIEDDAREEYTTFGTPPED
ncbi:MAG: hypothetical protein OEY14_02485 [Myxococcales bacterium]|nr:hypothetical protein [Myxococcales bacterium]